MQDLVVGELSIDDATEKVARSAGFAILLGEDERLVPVLFDNQRLLVHAMVQTEDKQSRFQSLSQRPGVIIEHWPNQSRLPHAENLVNLVVLGKGFQADRSEIERVLCPGGVLLVPSENGYFLWEKPAARGADEWTHQWHSPSGGLVTRDTNIGVPEGVQWLSGPLFAMAGRKSSTQSLVSAGGINFYVTQNVIENLSDEKNMPQYLVAKDAYNGMTLWQQSWTGPFVRGEGETNPRLVATSDRLYVAGEKRLIAIDAKSGEMAAEKQLNEDVDKLILVGGILVIQSKNAIQAITADLQTVAWQVDGLRPLELVATDESAYFLTRGRSSDGQFQHDLVCVDLATGKLRWKQNTQPHVTAESVRINFVEHNFIALQAHGHLHLFDAQEGSHLWSRTTDARPGKDYADERYVGHFYSQGLVWMLDQNAPRKPAGQNYWVGLEPSTGKLVRELTTSGEWPKTETPGKMGCQLLIASDRYIMIPRQATFVEIETGEKKSFKFTRGGCGQGFIPANGLLYSHPHACGCFSEAVRGFMGMHSNSSLLATYADADDGSRLIRLGDFSLKEEDNALNSWSIYRGNAQRGAASNEGVLPNRSSQIVKRWSRRLTSSERDASDEAWRLRAGQALTSITVGEDKAFVATVNRGELFAVNVATGETEWSFLANGRIDSPPTYYRGLCLFGAHDGYVYALNADSGKLVWKYRAAPTERRIVAFGSVESAWPVTGSVLVMDGLALVAAGRAPDADGGIFVSALNAESGKPLWTKTVDQERFFGVSDYLVADDKNQYAYLSNWRFDPRTGENGPAPKGVTHLQGGKVGLLEASWTQFDLAARKDMQTWNANKLAGQLLTFNAEHGASYNIDTGVVTVAGESFLEIKAPRQVTALCLAGAQLIVAGGNVRNDFSRGGFLEIWDTSTKELLGSYELGSPTVLDGVALANSSIFLTTQNGDVHCFSSAN